MKQQKQTQKQLMVGKSIKIEQILREANRLFCERSYAGTSMADIAGEVKITRQLMYAYFPTREKLLDQLLSSLFPMMNHEIFTCVSQDISAAEQLQRIEENAEQFWKKGVGFCLLPRLFMEFQCKPEELNRLLKHDCQKWYQRIEVLAMQAFAKNKAQQKAQEIWSRIFIQGLAPSMQQNLCFSCDFYSTGHQNGDIVSGY